MANPNQIARRGDLVNGSPQSKAGALKQVLWSKIAWFVAVASFFPVEANAWTNGELSIWMDGDRGRALCGVLLRLVNVRLGNALRLVDGAKRGLLRLRKRRKLIAGILLIWRGRNALSARK